MGWGGDDTTHAFCFIGFSFTLDATLVSSGWGWVGRGRDDTTHVFCFATGLSFTFDATLPDLRLALMLRHLLRCLILACPRCYAASSCLVSSGWGWVGWGGDDTTHVFCFTGFSFTLDATLVSSGWGWVGRGGDDTTHVFCFATGLSFTLDATLPDLKLALMLHHLLRCLILACP